MKRLAWLIALPVGAVAVVFAVSNLHRVTLSLWPLPYKLQVPAFMLALLALVVGILAGGAIAWFAQRDWRRRARRGEDRIAQLEKNLQTLRDERDKARQEAKRARQAEPVHAEPVPAGQGAKRPRLFQRSAS